MTTPAPDDRREPAKLDRLATARQRLVRGLGFARELLRAVRRDFGALWLPSSAGAAPPGPRAAGFKRRVEQLAEQLAVGDRLLMGLAAQPPAEALRLAEGFNLQALVAAAQAVDAEARALKGGTAGPAGTGPLGQAGAGRPNTAPLRSAPPDAGGPQPPARPGTGPIGGPQPLSSPGTGQIGGPQSPSRPGSGQSGATQLPARPGSGKIGDPQLPTRPGTGPVGRPQLPSRPATGQMGSPPPPARPATSPLPARPQPPDAARPATRPLPGLPPRQQLESSRSATRPLPAAPAQPGAGPLNPASAQSAAATQAAAAARGAIASAKQTGADSVGGLLRRWTAPAQVESQAAPPPATPPVVDAARRAFAAAHRLASEVLAYVSPRLAIVKVALAATGLPGRRREMTEIQETLYDESVAAGVPAPQMGFMPPLATLLHGDMTAAQRVHVALTQWGEATTVHADAERVAESLLAATSGRCSALEAFDLGRYRAAIFPVSHLHLSFAPYPWLRDLFPSPT